MILLAVLVAGALLGYGTTSLLQGKTAHTYKDGYRAGYEAARQKLKESNLFPEVPTETNTLSGTVLKTDKKSFTFESQNLALNPLEAEKTPSTRTVKITESTRIYRITPRNPEELQAEFERFQEAADPEARPPEPFPREDVDASAIQSGMIITVTADHNIFSEEVFEASEISLQAQPAPARMPEEENPSLE